MLSRCIGALAGDGGCSAVWVVAAAGDRTVADQLTGSLGPHLGVAQLLTVLAPDVAELDLIRRALAAVAAESGSGGQPSGLAGGDVVVVHDCGGAMAQAVVVRQLLTALGSARGAGFAGAVAVGPVTDTLKDVGPSGVVEGTLDRSGFGTLRTPQAFRVDRLAEALAVDCADDSGRRAADATAAATAGVLVEAVLASGNPILAVPTPPHLFAITSEQELELAEAVLASAQARAGGGQGPDRHLA